VRVTAPALAGRILVALIVLLVIGFLLVAGRSLDPTRYLIVHRT
jgi:hypothetical protein